MDHQPAESYHQLRLHSIATLVIYVLFAQMTVFATDQRPGTSRNDSALVYVTVDLDEYPIFQPASYSQTLPESQTIGSSVQKVFAVDNDLKVCLSLSTVLNSCSLPLS